MQKAYSKLFWGIVLLLVNHFILILVALFKTFGLQKDYMVIFFLTCEILKKCGFWKLVYGQKGKLVYGQKGSLHTTNHQCPVVKIPGLYLCIPACPRFTSHDQRSCLLPYLTPTTGKKHKIAKIKLNS